MPEKDSTIEMKILVDPKEAIAASKLFQKTLSKQLDKVAKYEKVANAGLLKHFTATRKFNKMVAPDLKKELALRKQLNDKLQEQESQLAKIQAVVKGLKERGDDEVTKKQIAAYEKKITEGKKLVDATKSAIVDFEKEVGNAEEVKEGLRKSLPEAAEASGELLISPLRDFMAKDAGALLKKSLKTVGWVGGRGLAGMGKAGAALKGTGGALGGVAGGALGGVGKALEAISKLGPILSGLGSFLAVFVKLALDAEDAAKKFNAQLLQTAGTSEFLHTNMNNLNLGSQDLESSLNRLRDGATAWSNVQWGISKDTAQAFIGALTAEGVSLKRLGREMDTTTGYAKGAAEVIQMSVAYSRAFGVSLNEVAQLQGEMMVDLGMSLTSVQSQFQYMTKGAEEAGIATNKFFGIIRSFSADLSLFTLRMEDVTKMMMALGKVMSPREAQKFLQTITQQFKGADLLTRVRAVAIGGAGPMKKILEKDLGNKIDKLGQDIENSVGEKGSGGEIIKILKDTSKKGRKNMDKNIRDYLAKHSQRMTNEQKSAVWDAARMQSKLMTGNLVDIASALKDAGPFAIYDAMEAMSQKMFKKPLEELSGDERLAASQAIGVSDEQLDQYYKMNMGIAQLQADLAYKLENNGELTQAELDALNKLGIDITKGTPAERAKALSDKKQRDVYDAMSQDQQQELLNSTKEINYQKKISDVQVSTLDKLTLIGDFLMNQIYNVLTLIRDAVIKLPFFSLKPLEQLQMSVDKMKNTALSQAVSGAKDVHDARVRAIETVGRNFIATLEKAKAEDLELIKEQATGKITTKRAGEIAQRRKELEPILKLSREQRVGSEKDLHALATGSFMATRSYDDFFKVLEKLSATANAPAAPAAAAPAAIAAAAPAAIAAPAVAAAVKDAPTESSQKDMVKAVETTKKKLLKGITIDKPTSAYTTAITGSTLDAIRQGLFEYYMYQSLDRASVLKAAKGGASPWSMLQKGIEKGSMEAALGEVLTAQGNQAGGVVTNVANGMANIKRLPPGEGWASVGRGEHILPAGGGRGGGVKVELALKGDLGRFVEARVVEGAANFERNRRLR